MRRLASFILVVFAVVHAGADEPWPVVGDLGSPDRLVVEGAQTFSPAEIVRELLGDLDVANAAYPTAPLDEFRRTIAEKTVAGYKSEGFAEATAETRLDDTLGKLVLTIVEGPRYIASEVHVSGLPQADADWLRDELTARAEELNDDRVSTAPPRPGARRKMARWPIGKPAWCADESFLALHRQIVDLFLDRSLIFPEFTIAAQLNRELHTAALAVIFTDRGQPALLDKIRRGSKLACFG
jgi:hypothetical protein